MATITTRATKHKIKAAHRLSFVPMTGFGPGDSVTNVRLVRAGLPFRKLADFQKATQLPWSEIARFVAIPLRTLTRRQSQGKLQPDESDRLWRASTIFSLAVDLFEGDIAAARKWMQSPQRDLGGETPLLFASTGVGAREVENLIGRLEHGVFS
jgi:putative toxin-antitoxin system antitoxin component (TIGR02293 family)